MNVLLYYFVNKKEIMDKEFVADGCECIQQLISVIEYHIHWDDFSFEEQEDIQTDIDVTKRFIYRLLKEYK